MSPQALESRFAALIRVVHPRPPAAQDPIDNERLKRRAAFAAGVEYVARASGAVLPLPWEDDGVTFLIPSDDPTALPMTAFRVAELIWQRAKIDLDWPVRVAAHVARVRSIDEMDADFKSEIARCCQAAAAPPTAALSVTEDVGLALSDDIREGLVRLRSSVGEPVYMAGGATSNGADDPVGALSDSLRKYVRGGDFARLRYVGFRLLIDVNYSCRSTTTIFAGRRQVVPHVPRRPFARSRSGSCRHLQGNCRRRASARCPRRLPVPRAAVPLR